jgi:hypothetical protein
VPKKKVAFTINKIVNFWILPNGINLAFIPGVFPGACDIGLGNVLWAQAILDAFYPERAKKHNNFKPIIANRNQAAAYFFVPTTADPKGTLLGVFRHPIERFRSWFFEAAKNRPVDSFVESIVTGKEKHINAHIRKVSIFGDIIKKVKWYRCERDLEALAKAIGLSKMPDMNGPEQPKVDLTDDQIAKLTQYYADDIAIWKKI